MMIAAYQYDFQVPDAAVDANGHANNVEYLRWMQTAATLHADATGCTQACREIGASWVVRSHWIEYFRPAFAGNRITVLTWVAEMARATSLRRYKVLRPDDNVVLAKAETDWVFIDATSGRPRAIPPVIKALFVLVPPDQEP